MSPCPNWAYNKPMRRLLTFAAFFLIIAILPVCAQRGGARGSGGSHGGFSGGHGGGFSGHSGFVGHGSGGVHVASGFNSHYIPRLGLGPRSFGRGEHVRGERFHERGFRRHCFGCYGYGYGYGYGYPYASFYDPFWWGDSYSSYDADAERERQIAAEMNAENLDEQRRREDEQDAYAPRYSRPARQSREMESSAERASDGPNTVLVFRDQHQREIQNYAIVGSMLWNFTPQRTEKIPIADLDVPATTKANDDRGIDFKLPRASEGQ